MAEASGNRTADLHNCDPYVVSSLSSDVTENGLPLVSTQHETTVDLSDALVFTPGDILLFQDDQHHPSGGNLNDLNRMGILIGPEGALYYLEADGLRRARIEFLPSKKFGTLKKMETRQSPLTHIGDQVAAFFVKHRTNPAHFYAGMGALFHGNDGIFLQGQLHPTRPRYKNKQEAEQAWRDFKQKIQPGDILLTTDTTSAISRLVAWSTDGPWSHIAYCENNTTISEMVTTGPRRVPIETYKDAKHWIGLYRDSTVLKKPRGLIDTRIFLERHVLPERKYSHWQAAKAGWKAFRGDHSARDVPNSVMHTGHAKLIAQYGGY
jgi:hypothetical protein